MAGKDEGMSPQNVYDDPTFFAGYQQMRERRDGMHEFVVRPTMAALLPDMRGKRVLDVGCGDGWFCRLAAESGARSVLGIDASERMLQLARERTADQGIHYERARMEDLALPDASADLVVSILALHYVADIAAVLRAVARALTTGGTAILIFEHPIETAPPDDPDVVEVEGSKVWPLRDYFAEGQRRRQWWIDGVEYYHRTMSSYLNALLEAGLTLDTVLEPIAPLDSLPERDADRVRPRLLALRAVKGGTTPRA